jgi:hypothetical protein
MGAYREDRRVGSVRRLGLVTAGEAAEMTDVQRERRYETQREALAVERRRGARAPARRFEDLLAGLPGRR